MRFSDEMQEIRKQNLEIARMETADMSPQKDLYTMSVVHNGREQRIYYSWPELKGHQYCKDYFARQEKINREIEQQTESEISDLKKKFEETTGKAFDVEDDDPEDEDGEDIQEPVIDREEF